MMMTKENENVFVSMGFINETKTANGPTQLLFESIQRGSAVGVRRALDEGANIDAVRKEDNDRTVLHMAAALNSKDCLVLLLGHSKKPRLSMDANGQTALHICAQSASGLVHLALLIAAYGLNNMVDRHGNTFLHYLLYNRRVPEAELIEFMKWVVCCEMSLPILNTINKQGDTVTDVALQTRGHSGYLLQILLSSGAQQAKNIYASVRQHVLNMEDEDRNKKVVSEEKRWRRLMSLFAKYRAVLSHYLTKRLLLMDNEEDRRRRVWLSEQRGRGRIAERLVEELIRIKTMEQERCLVWNKPVQEQQLVVSPPVLRDTEDQVNIAVAAAFNSHDIQNKTKQMSSVDNDNSLSNIDVEAKRAAAVRIWLTYVKYKRRKLRDHFVREWLQKTISPLFSAVVCLQAHFRGHLIKREYKQLLRSVFIIQRVWRRFAMRRGRAVDIIRKQLECHQAFWRVKQVIREGSELLLKERIRRVMYSVTRLLWRENFCAAFCEIVFRRKREHSPRLMRENWYTRLRAEQLKLLKWLLLAQFLLGLFMLFFIGAAPHLTHTRNAKVVDITVSVILLLMQVAMPCGFWRLTDCIIILIAVISAIFQYRRGVCILTLLTLKLPFVIRAFFPTHSGTCTYCCAIEQTAFHLLLLAPLGLAGIGACVCSLVVNDAVLNASGNWGDVFLTLWSSVSPQYKMERLYNRSEFMSEEKTHLIPNLQMKMKRTVHNIGDYVLLREQTPVLELAIAKLVLAFWMWAAVFIAVHDAIRKHYDRSDETKLWKKKRGFRDVRKRDLFNEAHRAKNMTALGKQLDGVLWEADVRAAKEAIDASHCDHKADNKVHRFVRRVQDSVVAGEMEFGSRNRTKTLVSSVPITTEWGKWDCRNEHPESRFMYDVGIIEAALGMRERLTFIQRLMQRQWVGPVDGRETTLFIITLLIMALVQPNNYWTEMSFSLVFALELFLSFCFLRIEFILKRYFRFFIRIFCIVVGFLPSTIPFVILRFFRFCEGWSNMFPVPGMMRYGLLYLLVSFFTMYMICFVAMWQFHVESGGRGICNSVYSCLYTSVREMVLSVWTPTHINVVTEPFVACIVITAFQLVFIPIIVTSMLHPLLHLSSFIGRFIRLVVQSLHHDAIEYINSYLEGPSWFTHWRIHCGLTPRTITKLRMWVYDIRRRRAANGRVNASSPWRPYLCLKDSYVRVMRCSEGTTDGVCCGESIISKSQFASFEENEAYHNPSMTRHKFFLRVSRLLRKPLLHYIHTAITLTSIVFLWVVDASSTLQDPKAVVAIVIHMMSMVTALITIPRDASAILTLLNISVLAVSLGMQYSSHLKLRHFFCIRFFSLCRLGQLHVLFICGMRGFARMTHLSFRYGVSILFPVIVTGCIVYVAELLRSQIYLVHNYKPIMNNETISSWSLPQRLASHLRRNEWYPNGEDVQELFAYFLRQDAPIMFSFFDLWLLPAISVATALTYLRWTNTIILNSQCLFIDSIRLLEDPMVLAGFNINCSYFRWIGNGVLLASLFFGVIFSPKKNTTAVDPKFFFLLELFFTLFGFFDSFLRFLFAICRYCCSWEAWSCMPQGLVDKKVVMGNTVLLLAELLQLLYWSCVLPLALTLLIEGETCLISPTHYAMYFITFRFALVLRMLPRAYVLLLTLKVEAFIFTGVCIVGYFVAAASAIADAYVAISGEVMTARLLYIAFRDLWRQTITLAAPSEVKKIWIPSNYTEVVQDMIASNLSTRVILIDYVSSLPLLILAIFGRLILAALFGLMFAVLFVPMRSLIFSAMSKKAFFLYKTLLGGTNAIVDVGARFHDDMRPEDRKKIQRRKFARMFQDRGIPMWLLPHLFEEIGMFKPGQQRRLMFTLEQLFVFLPISERRAECVEEYTYEWRLYNSGGPGRLSFSELPVYPARRKEVDDKHNVNNTMTTAVYSRYVPPLRLVQAIALLEFGFPPHSSAGSKIWLEFFKVTQRIRGATLMQSLWRMYTTVRDFESDSEHSKKDILMARILRRSFRRNRVLSRVTFLYRDSFSEAVRCQPNIFNPGTGHYDVLNRLRGHLLELQPTIQLRLHKFPVLANLLSYGSSTSARPSVNRSARSFLEVPTEQMNPLLAPSGV